MHQNKISGLFRLECIGRNTGKQKTLITEKVICED